MANRKRGVLVPSAMRRDIELYCLRTAQKEGRKFFSIGSFTVRCGLSTRTMGRVLEGTEEVSEAVIKRINRVLHNGERFDGQSIKKVSSVTGKLCEIPTWLIPAIRTHLESKKNDKAAELEVGIVGGSLRKICNGTRLSVKEPTLEKLLEFYKDYHTVPTELSPSDQTRPQVESRDTVTAHAEKVSKLVTPKGNRPAKPQVESRDMTYINFPEEKQSTDQPKKEQPPPSGQTRPQVESSVYASECTTALANRLIDAFNHLDTTSRETLCYVAECIAVSKGKVSKTYVEGLEMRLDRQNKEADTAIIERDRREASFLNEIERQRVVVEDLEKNATLDWRSQCEYQKGLVSRLRAERNKLSSKAANLEGDKREDIENLKARIEDESKAAEKWKYRYEAVKNVMNDLRM